MMDALLSESCDPEAEMKSYAKEVPLGCFAQPDDVAPKRCCTWPPMKLHIPAVLSIR